ncbi:hypothetical protein ACX80W_01715 [Arthrobacter sp. TMN-37]
MVESAGGAASIDIVAETPGSVSFNLADGTVQFYRVADLMKALEDEGVLD